MQSQIRQAESRTTGDVAEASRIQETKEDSRSSFESLREIVESIVFALLLAFFIKTFETEAYVIPTGSMATTLKGRHKDVNCEECGFRFQVNASEEVDSGTNSLNGEQVLGGTCPQCGYTQFFGTTSPSYCGDRILVSKCTFDDRPVNRWDVSVFRSPTDPKINFIKRIVGIPEEKIRIQYGDIFTQKKGPGKFVAKADQAKDPGADFEIERKPTVNLQQMLLTVYDNNFQLSDEIYKLGWPRSWYDEMTESQQGYSAWRPSDDYRGFTFNGDIQKTDPATVKTLVPEAQVKYSPDPKEPAGIHWLRYRHLVPSSLDWISLKNRTLPEKAQQTGILKNNPQLILDFSPYNSGITTQEVSNRLVFPNGKGGYQCYRNPRGFGANWVGDLSFDCTVTFLDDKFSEQEELLFELVKGGQRFLCRINPFSGRTAFEIPGIAAYTPDTVVYKYTKGTWHFQFMNIDEQMRLLINGKEIDFPRQGRYDQLCKPFANGQPAAIPRNRDPNEKDLAPVAIGVRFLKVKVENLKISRDLYYIATGTEMEHNPPELYSIGNSKSDRLLARSIYNVENSLMSDANDSMATAEEFHSKFHSAPANWKGYGNTMSAIFDLKEGQYLALGDNSCNSEDSRWWRKSESQTGVSYFVDRKFLIGKAFFVYWPHGSMIPGTKLPFVPELQRCRHID